MKKKQPKKERSPYSKRFIILGETSNITFKLSKNITNNKCIKFKNTHTNARANLELK